jgi:hypothetical protein
LLTWRTAAARPKVALTQIDGDASGDVRDAVADALDGKDLSLIASKEVNRAVDKIGDPADLTEKDFKKLASELEADAIVTGKLDKSGVSKTLKFRLYVHRKMAKGFTVSFKDAKSEKFRSMLHDKMVDKIGSAAGEGEGENEKLARDDKPKKKTDAVADDDDSRASKAKKSARKPKAGGSAEDEDDDARPAQTAQSARPARSAKPSEDDAEDRPAKRARPARPGEEEDAKATPSARSARSAKPSDDEPAAPAGEPAAPRKATRKLAAADREDRDELEASAPAPGAPVRTANRAAARIEVGASMLKRSFAFNAQSGPGGPHDTALPVVGGARVQGEVYPLALTGSTRFAAGFGIAADYDKTIKLNLSTSLMPGVKVPVKQSAYAVALNYRYLFGQTATSSSLTASVGYGKRLFSPDRSTLSDAAAAAAVARDAPTTNYAIIEPGLSVRLPVTRIFALSLGGKGMLISNAGPIQGTTSYGRAKIYGIDAIGGLEIALGNRFLVRLAGEFVQIGYAFQNAGALSDGSNGGPKVGGLADQSVGGSATLAVVY